MAFAQLLQNFVHSLHLVYTSKQIVSFEIEHLKAFSVSSQSYNPPNFTYISLMQGYLSAATSDVSTEIGCTTFINNYIVTRNNIQHYMTNDIVLKQVLCNQFQCANSLFRAYLYLIEIIETLKAANKIYCSPFIVLAFGFNIVSAGDSQTMVMTKRKIRRILTIII